jgi:23S rRNA (cytosine1962-C5)-methyltransferase/23S rRNA (guanine2445-N2)-methyltransferase / 23S rRNA (guanine2069-N7)-methyltransferase
MIKNRLEKNLKKFKPWAEKNKIEAYRLYDKDIPEYPFLVDIYKDYCVIYDKTEIIDEGKNKDLDVVKAVEELLQFPSDKVILKKRERQKGVSQYNKLEATNRRFQVLENGVPVLVNLWDYLDTGLFIDHRPMRYFFLKNSKQKKLLNLFSYTCVVSLMAAKGGAQTVSVDMSKNYLNWGEDNFKLNNIDLNQHRFIEQNAMEFLNTACEWPDYEHSFDMVFLDPPTFSNSKDMLEDFEVEKDQKFIIEQSMKFLKPDGVLYFSTNKRKFKLDTALEAVFNIKNTTEKTIPQDCFDQKIHHSFEIRRKS